MLNFTLNVCLILCVYVCKVIAYRYNIRLIRKVYINMYVGKLNRTLACNEGDDDVDDVMWWNWGVSDGLVVIYTSIRGSIDFTADVCCRL